MARRADERPAAAAAGRRRQQRGGDGGLLECKLGRLSVWVVADAVQVVPARRTDAGARRSSARQAGAGGAVLHTSTSRLGARVHARARAQRLGRVAHFGRIATASAARGA